MEFNVNNQLKKRIFTIACRKGHSILTDSKQNENGNGTLKQFEAENSQMACLIALNDVLTRMPQGVKFDYAVAILLPQTISFLAYEDTRNFWLANGCKKTGEVIEENVLAEVRKMHKLLKAHGSNVQLFNQTRLTSPLYKSYSRATWEVMEQLYPSENGVVSCTDFE